ncbi:MAG: methyltransferase domain-containing protein [Betaproteobacteria bacterium]|nr:methyltransferase domain-containing protein [Betaproteobacteria bacterium]
MTSRIRDGRAALAALLLALLPATSNAIEEVPFVTTPDKVTHAMLELAKVGPGDHVIDLGSGDGRIVITAAKRFGATGLGVEIVPDLVAKSVENARLAGVEGKVRFLVQDLFQTDLAPATVVTMYLLPDVNLKLRPSLLALKAGTRIVSHDWDLGDWKPDRRLTIEDATKKIGLRKASDIYLWVVPTDVDGLWCGTGNATGTKMTISQSFQRATGTVSNVRGVHHFEGRIDARRLDATSGDGKIGFDVSGDDLKVRGAEGVYAHLEGTPFKRSCCGSCRDY